MIAGNAAVLVHNCGEGSHIKLGDNDRVFAAHDEARAQALSAHGVSDPSLVESSGPLYGKNPNLTGPKGEPWEQLNAINDDGDLVTIDHHANGHFFNDTNEWSLPHYHGPNGEHYFYGDMSGGYFGCSCGLG